MMLCFVITLEQGRVKPSDRLTMELVFEALNQVPFLPPVYMVCQIANQQRDTVLEFLTF